MDTKKIIIILALIAINLSAFAQSTYTDSQYGYEITFPEEWEKKEIEGVEYITASNSTLEYSVSCSQVDFSTSVKNLIGFYKGAESFYYQIGDYQVAIFSGKLTGNKGESNGYLYLLQKANTSELYSISVQSYSGDMPNQTVLENYVGSFKAKDDFQLTFENGTLQVDSVISKEEFYDFRPLTVSLKAGYAYNWLSGLESKYNQGLRMTCLQAGLNLTYAFSNNVGVETGMSYLWNAGTTYSYSENEITVEGDVNLDYIVIPVHFKYDFLNGLNVKSAESAGIALGLNYGIFQKGTETIKATGYGNTASDYLELDDIANNTTSLNIGTYYSNSRVFNAGMDINIGVNEILKDTDIKLHQILFFMVLKF